MDKLKSRGRRRRTRRATPSSARAKETESEIWGGVCGLSLSLGWIAGPGGGFGGFRLAGSLLWLLNEMDRRVAIFHSTGDGGFLGQRTNKTDRQQHDTYSSLKFAGDYTTVRVRLLLLRRVDSVASYRMRLTLPVDHGWT